MSPGYEQASWSPEDRTSNLEYEFVIFETCVVVLTLVVLVLVFCCAAAATAATAAATNAVRFAGV